jgi:serine O-acetyltransferase
MHIAAQVSTFTRGAQIAAPVFIDHGTGIVIGQTTIIGKNVKLYQGVTLGALAVLKEESGKKRHPTIEDDVIIYAGKLHLGRHHRCGSQFNNWRQRVFNRKHPAILAFAYHKSEVKIRDKSEMKSLIDFVI